MSILAINRPPDVNPPRIPQLVRPPAHHLHPDSQYLDLSSTIAFFHPGYSLDGYHDPQVEIIRLPAYDNYGFHHGTALSALAIITYNQPGYFTVDSPAGDRVDAGWDYIMPSNRNYYYHLHDKSAHPRYPVCPSFGDWHLDRSMIPIEWRSAFRLNNSLDPALIYPDNASDGPLWDISCRITGSTDVTGIVHLVPKSEDNWFHLNGLGNLNYSIRPSANAIDDMKNSFRLRKDISLALDQKMFCLVAKQGVVVSHYLKPTNHMAAVYHNARFRMPWTEPPVEFYWVRFGWSIFPSHDVLAGKIDSFEARMAKLGRPSGVEVVTNAQKRIAHVSGGVKKRKQREPRKSSSVIRPRNATSISLQSSTPDNEQDFEFVFEGQCDQAFCSASNMPQLGMQPNPDIRDQFCKEIKQETSLSDNDPWNSVDPIPSNEQVEGTQTWWNEYPPQISQDGGPQHSSGPWDVQEAYDGGIKMNFLHWNPGKGNGKYIGGGY